MIEGSRVNFVMREALFEIYTWILCLSLYHKKQTSRIQFRGRESGHFKIL